MLKYEQMEYFSTYCCLYSEYFTYICYQIKKLNYGDISDIFIPFKEGRV